MSGLLARLDPLLGAVPTVERPRGRLPFPTRLYWTFLVATVYLVMSITPLYGLGPNVQQFANPLISIIFGSTAGTLAHLGIGPIVIAGIIMEILVFSRVLNIDLSVPENRARFTLLLKVVALAVAFFEVMVGIASGQFGLLTPLNAALILAQLMLATLIIIMLDDLMSKGWGIGSAISLIIFIGVAKSIFWALFSPETVVVTEQGPQLITPDGLPYGVVPALFVALYEAVALGDAARLGSILYRGGGFPDLTSLIVTLAVGAAVLFLEMTRVQIPVAAAQYRGVKFTIPLKFIYVSVLPLIFTAYSLVLVSQILQGIWATFNPNNDNPILNVLAMAVVSETGSVVPLRPSLLYYVTPPRGPITADYVVVHIAMFMVLATAFAWIWVSLAGLSPEEQARRFVESGLQVPGFRMSERVIAKLLERYVWTLTVASGMVVGFVAAVGDIVGILGGGIGLILLIEIAQQYYEVAMREQVLDMYPGLRRVLGE